MDRKIRPLFLLIIVLLMGTSCSKDSSEAQQFITAYDKAHFKAYPYPLTHSDTLIVRHNYDGDFEAYLDFRIKNMKRIRDQYTWERVGNHLLVGADKARQMARELGFDHPYYFVQYLKCDTIDNPLRKDILEGLQGRLAEKHDFIPPDMPQFNTSNLMGVALKYSAIDDKKGRMEKIKERYQKHPLDVNFEKVNNLIQSDKISDKEKRMKVNLVYSAFRRAHEHTEIKDGLFQMNVESGKEIGISPTLFKIYKATLDETNEGILKAREQNPDRAINGKADGVVDRKNWDWEFCMGLYEKYGK